MATIAYQRLKRELKDVQVEEKDALGITLVPVDDQLTLLKGEIYGPPDSPYENGIFTLRVEVPDTYPFRPPEVRFQTKVWHPNVSSQTGVICLDILKNQWAASMTLRTMMLSLRALFCSPEPTDPQDAIVARQYMRDKELFDQTAKFWTQVYAKAPGEKQRDMTQKVQTIVDMGFPEEAAMRALSQADWNVERATTNIIS